MDWTHKDKDTSWSTPLAVREYSLFSSANERALKVALYTARVEQFDTAAEIYEKVSSVAYLSERAIQRVPVLPLYPLSSKLRSLSLV